MCTVTSVLHQAEVDRHWPVKNTQKMEKICGCITQNALNVKKIGVKIFLGSVINEVQRKLFLFLCSVISVP